MNTFIIKNVFKNLLKFLNRRQASLFTSGRQNDVSVELSEQSLDDGEADAFVGASDHCDLCHLQKFNNWPSKCEAKLATKNFLFWSRLTTIQLAIAQRTLGTWSVV